MTRDIRISVVIPVYNAAATVLESVQSCLSQSRPPHEVIVVDDGSTDGTAQLLRERFGERIQIIQLWKNEGPAGARNRGVRLCSGTHIAFQDSDDVWHPDKLKIVADILQRYPGIRFLWHPYTLQPLQPVADGAVPEPRLFPFRSLLWSNPIGTPCVIVHRKEIRLFNTRMRHMEDYDLFLRIGVRTGLWMIPLALTRLGRPILSAGGQSSSRWSMRRGELQAYGHLVRDRPIFVLLYSTLR